MLQDLLYIKFLLIFDNSSVKIHEMDCHWLRTTPSLSKGIFVINELEVTKFEQFMRRIVAKLKVQDNQIFTEDEINKLKLIFKIDAESLELVVKTVLYIFKRILKYIFMPTNVTSDLTKLGLSCEKAEVFLQVWSLETKTTLEELETEVLDDSGNSINFTWQLNAELSSDYHQKCKVPKTYLSFNTTKKDLQLELTHSELHSIFLQLDSIQNELDNLV